MFQLLYLIPTFAYLVCISVTILWFCFINCDSLLFGRLIVMSLASLAIFLIVFTGVGLFWLVWLVMITVW